MKWLFQSRLISCNHDPDPVPVEFVVLHYTGCSLEQTLKIFQNPGSKVSAHLIIDRQGKVIETVPCLTPPCLRAWHAGHSFWQEEEGQPPPFWRGFNNFSLGIELVSNNGNLFPYTQKQYQALHLLLKKLKSIYLALQNPHRILGHEHIAGHRGKIDPGHRFDWQRFFKMNYPPTARVPVRRPALCTPHLKMFSTLLRKTPPARGNWTSFNTKMEQQALQDFAGPKNPPSQGGGGKKK